MADTEEALKRIYHDPGQAGAFAGAEALYREARRQGVRVSLKEVKHFLRGQDAYTLHRRLVRIKKNVMNERIFASGPYDLWEADLMDPTKGRRPARRGPGSTAIKFWLVVIDAFTRYAWVEGVKSKSAGDMVEAFRKIMDQALPPHAKLNHLRTDQGTEFLAQRVRDYLRSRGVNHYIAQKEPGAALAERFIRTLGEKYEKYVTANPEVTKRTLTDMLPSFVDGYNRSHHSGVRHPPAELQAAAYRLGSRSAEAIMEAMRKDPKSGEDDARILQDAHNKSQTTMGRYKQENPKDPVKGPRAEVPLGPGQDVRVVVRKSIFEKGRKKNYTDEIWRVKETNAGGNPNSYQLEDDQGEEMIGRVYRQFVQPVRKSGVYEVVVLRRQGQYLLVRWVGYGQTEPDQWIHRDTLVNTR